MTNDDSLQDWIDKRCDEICKEKGISKEQLYNAMAKYVSHLEHDLQEKGVNVEFLNKLNRMNNGKNS